MGKKLDGQDLNLTVVKVPGTVRPRLFLHPSPIGNGINIHLKTCAGFPLLTGKSPNSIKSPLQSGPLYLSSSIFYVRIIPSRAVLGDSMWGGVRRTDRPGEKS